MKKFKMFLLVLGSILLIFIGRMLFVLFLVWLLTLGSKVEVNTDISRYNDFLGQNALEEYKNKWGMDESIFPSGITDNMQVLDYKMVYYNPWDAQYLSYLVVNYDANDYQAEVARLNNYKSTNYKGYYGVNGFSKYDLLAINADSYQGFVYAITDNDKKIIYVELIFCNYFFDLDYKKYINTDYLPDGFDASLNNSYSKKMLSKN